MSEVTLELKCNLKGIWHQKKVITQKKEDITNLSRKKKTLIIIGETVFVASLNKDAIIEEILDNFVVIRVGLIKMSVKNSDIFETSSNIHLKRHQTNSLGQKLGI